MNKRDALKWAFATVGLGRLQTHLEGLKAMAAGSDVDDIDILERTTAHVREFVRAHSGVQSLEDMQPETCERLVAAANELSGLAFKCFRALALTREPLVDVLANWYAKDNFGRSDCAQLEALMA